MCLTLHELQYLDREHPHHFTLDLDQLDRIFEYRFIDRYRAKSKPKRPELVYSARQRGALELVVECPIAQRGDIVR